jgi:hypothetical protein
MSRAQTIHIKSVLRSWKANTVYVTRAYRRRGMVLLQQFVDIGCGLRWLFIRRT